MDPAGNPSAAYRRRSLCLKLLFYPLICLGLFTIITPLLSLIVFSPPKFQVDSISISFDDNNVAKWIISFSVSNPNFYTLRYRKIEVAVGGRRPQNSTVVRITPMFKQRRDDRSSRNATVYVGLPSPRPALIVDGSEFDIRFLFEYVYVTGKKGAAVAVCGNNNVRLWTSNGEVAMVGARWHVIKVVSNQYMLVGRLIQYLSWLLNIAYADLA